MRSTPAWFLVAAIAASMPAMGQESSSSKRSVRTGYAKVLRVEPVFQTLTATRMEQRCNGEVVPTTPPPAPLPPNCAMVPVEREFRRPIAYDVDYVYRGLKYRSRLPYDPGNRLRVQVSIQPYVSPTDDD